MAETWYLANDMQLFLISPLLIYPLWRWKKAGLIWLSFITVGSLTANFVVHAVYGIAAEQFSTRPYSKY